MGSIPITRFHSGWTAGSRGSVAKQIASRRYRGSSSRRGEHEWREPGQIVGDMTDNMLPWLSW